MTNEQIEKNNHIPNAEIEQDIRDTEAEIKDYQDEMNVLERHPQENKVRIYMIKGHIFNHQDFCKRLNEILEYRKQREAKSDLS